MKVNGGESLVNALKKLGIESSFGIVGSSLLEVFDLLPAAGIDYIGTRHEQWAGHMADGYARVSGKTPAVFLQNGAGLTNVVTAASTEMKANSPTIYISGSPLSKAIGRGTYQEEDHVAVMSPVTKWSKQTERPDRIYENARIAFQIANAVPKGPTHLDIPRDYLYEEVEYDFHESYISLGNNLTYLNNETLIQIENLIKNSDSPVLLAGGACNDYTTSNNLVEFSRRLAIPICVTYGHNDVIPYEYELMMGSIGRGGSEAAMDIVKNADLIIAVGTRLDEFTFLPYYGYKYLQDKTKIIQFNANPEHLGRSVNIDVGVLCTADVAANSLVKISQRISLGEQAMNNRIERSKSSRKIWEEKMIRRDASSDQMDIKDVYLYLRDNLPKDAIISVDIGSSPSFSYSLLKFHQTRTFMPPGTLGGVGFSIPAAIGASYAAKNRPVYAILGDGAFTMELSALITAKEYNIPINAIVFDNSAWGAEKANQQYFYDSNFVGTNLKNPDLVKVARELGAYAEEVDSYSKLSQTAKDVFSNKGVNVLVAKVDPLNFPLPARRDALKKPFRGLYK